MKFELWKTNQLLARNRLRNVLLPCIVGCWGPLSDEILPPQMDSSLWGYWLLEQNDASKEKISHEDPCLLLCLEEFINLKISLVSLPREYLLSGSDFI